MSRAADAERAAKDSWCGGLGLLVTNGLKRIESGCAMRRNEARQSRDSYQRTCPLGLQTFGDAHRRCLERGHQAEEQSGRNADREREREDAGIDAQIIEEWKAATFAQAIRRRAPTAPNKPSTRGPTGPTNASRIGSTRSLVSLCHWGSACARRRQRRHSTFASDQAVRLAIRQPLQQNRIDDGKDGRVRADAKPECHHRYHRDRRRFAQPARGQLDVLGQAVDFEPGTADLPDQDQFFATALARIRGLPDVELATPRKHAAALPRYPSRHPLRGLARRAPYPYYVRGDCPWRTPVCAPA